MTTKAVQYFSEDYLRHCLKMTIEERLQYLEDFRNLFYEVQSNETKSETKLISIKMPLNLLNALKQKAEMEGIPYQTLMKEILKRNL
jgi:predicted DNA binding CopG/RHH family protein